jgi:hypothetical protein
MTAPCWKLNPFTRRVDGVVRGLKEEAAALYRGHNAARGNGLPIERRYGAASLNVVNSDLRTLQRRNANGQRPGYRVDYYRDGCQPRAQYTHGRGS